ncbi:ethanolamine utilization protein EutN [Scopulibacillus darangshiensis]|uniref:Ethanolamine utilization protein EutN n=1 Tax=Scopulibacillus darangshiensis TaxID=442528 RepID=A0A4R2P959_9BACL|nr:EutN/CcmL family microcompartment protein [Scopulibacillus darangshiensis]TCP31543.1 ethanolamine utilization protein EutN [Scopulibacillus darangshiensis]
MLIGKVIGSVWATQKESGMENIKLLIVQPIDSKGHPLIAADRIGAGVGEQVLVTRGTPAHTVWGEQNAPIDAAIVGIVDSLEINE